MYDDFKFYVISEETWVGILNKELLSNTFIGMQLHFFFPNGNQSFQTIFYSHWCLIAEFYEHINFTDITVLEVEFNINHFIFTS